MRQALAGQKGKGIMLRERHAEIDLVVTDIEMPRLDGMGLTREIRADKRFAGLPVIAGTSLSGEEDERRRVSARPPLTSRARRSLDGDAAIS